MPKLIGNPYYAHLNKPTERVQRGKKVFEPTYDIQLALDESQVKEAKKLGLTVKDPTDAIPLPFHKFTTKVEAEEHTQFQPRGRRPKIYDKNGRELDRAPIMSPESKVAVIFAVKKYDGDAKALIRGVQILELVVPEGYEENGGVDIDTDVESELIIADPTEEVDAELNDSLDDL